MAFFAAIGAGLTYLAKKYGMLAIKVGAAGVVAKYNRDKRRRNQSVTYKNTPERADINRDEPVPIAYGNNRVVGTLIYREDTVEFGDEYDCAYAFCEGEVEEVSAVQINGVPVGELDNFTVTTYTGTPHQTGDSIFEEGLFKIVAEQDAYTDENNANTNYTSTDPNYLDVNKDAGSAEKRPYLKFDLSNLPPGLTFDSAKIVLWGKERTSTGRVAAWTVGDETMDEDTLTWNTQPADVASGADTPFLTAPETQQVFTLNATGRAYITAKYGATTTATFFLACTTASTGAVYASTRSQWPSPYLSIKYSGGDANGYKNTAYAALHIDPSNEKMGNTNPTVSAWIRGRKVKQWDETNEAYIFDEERTPAWQEWDFLTNTRYGAGIAESDIEASGFKTVASYCDADVTNDDGESVDRYTSDLVIDGGANGSQGINMIHRTFGGYLFSNNGEINLGVEKAPTTIETSAGLLLDATLEESTLTTGSELVTNGTMEADSDWADYSFPVSNTRSDEQAHTGTYSRKVVTDGVGNAGIQQEVVGTVGLAYTLESWVYISSIDQSNFRMWWTSADLDIEARTGAWYELEKIRRFTADDTLLLYTGGNATATFYVDDVSIKEYYLSDASSNARHLSPNAEPTWTTLSSGLTVPVFDGADSLMDTGADDIGTGGVTVEAWINPATYGEDFGRLFDNGRFIVYLNNNVNHLVVTSDTATSISYVGAITENVWQHLVITRKSSGAASLYMNGVLVGAADQNSGTPTAGSTNLFIGNNAAATRTWDGNLSRARIYNGILTAAQIRNRYINTKTDYGL